MLIPDTRTTRQTGRALVAHTSGIFRITVVPWTLFRGPTLDSSAQVFGASLTVEYICMLRAGSSTTAGGSACKKSLCKSTRTVCGRDPCWPCGYSSWRSKLLLRFRQLRQTHSPKRHPSRASERCTKSAFPYVKKIDGESGVRAKLQ